MFAEGWAISDHGMVMLCNGMIVVSSTIVCIHYYHTLCHEIIQSNPRIHLIHQSELRISITSQPCQVKKQVAGKKNDKL